MDLPFEWRVALRHLRSRRRNRFISLITVISVVGIALGVGTLITVIAVMSGFSGYLKDRILGTTSHLIVQGVGGPIANHREIAQQALMEPGILAASPYVMGQGMLKMGDGVTGLVVRGVDPEGEAKVNDLARNMTLGALSEMTDGGVLLGIELARIHSIKLGEDVTLISPTEVSTPFGMVPMLKKLKVEGFFQTGVYEYDTGLAIMTLPAAQAFFDVGGDATGVALKAADVLKTEELSFRLQARLGDGVWVRDWREMNSNLFAALELEKITMFVILTLIVLVAAFNIIGTLVMVVMEKGREIAILKAMGASRGSVGRIFFLEGLLMGMTGTVMGLILGITLCWALANYKFVELPATVYYVSTMQVRVQPLDVAIICVSAVLLSVLAGIYPARKAGSLDPVEILRYE